MIRIGVLKDSDGRVALVPHDIAGIVKRGIGVFVESGLGEKALFDDEEYKAVGSQIVGRTDVINNSDVIISINFPEDVQLRKGQTLICLTYFLWYKERALKTAEAKGTLIALDAIPRVTRAQPMDVLSSQATIAGY